MLTYKDIKNDKEIIALMNGAEQQIEALGFTEHSSRHSSIVAKWSGEILRKIGATEREIRLAEIAGYLHDIGNGVNRVNHAQSGAILAYNILNRLKFPYEDCADIMMAIGNHDEQYGTPVNVISSALIIADKADVHKSRVNVQQKKIPAELQNIHDRVNLAAESSFVSYDAESQTINIEIVINTEMCEVMDYFEIYFGRMQMCRKAAAFLGKKFGLIINKVKLL